MNVAFGTHIARSLLAIVLALAPGSSVAQAQWPQWGGPNRNFTVETSGLADEWPEGGPKRLWHRELGDGYSAIVYDDGVLYTMYRKGRTSPEEFTIALNAKSGETMWEHANRAPLMSSDDSGWGGQGPNSTPLVAQSRLYTVGSRSAVHCFAKETGEVIWKADLGDKLGIPMNRHVGYPCSPIVYKESIILPVYGEWPSGTAPGSSELSGKPTLVALDLSSGEILWTTDGFVVRESSPILITFEGQEQLVCDTNGGIIGVDPGNGKVLWRYPQTGSIVTPVWNGADLLFYTSGGDDAIGLVVKLTKEGGKTVPSELWVNRKIRIWQPTPVRIDDHLFGSTSELMLGVNMLTGKRTWAKRGFPMASCVYGDGKLIILDQDGQLTLATATPENLTVHSQCRITERYSFTVPTLVGKTLYARDRKHIMALDLGKSTTEDG